ncbi:MAG: 3-hydroxyacyl-ACP dehydratase FabZ [Phycisphaeraceae bacterium]|nr:3-hydroxyacyl-ACP dehydratase FabZ [Phycisphaeraceae bacterium]
MPATSRNPGPCRQRTLARAVSVSGVGLFTARPATVTIHPAEADSGIVFRRTDLPGAPSAPARIENVVDRPRRTALRAPGAPADSADALVETVEHLLSALAGLGVDNARIDIDGPEVPIGDGSAKLFADTLAEAGLVEQDADRRPIVITEPITVRATHTGEGAESVIVALPSESATLELLYDLDYGASNPLGRQVAAFTLNLGAPPASPGQQGDPLANGALSSSPYAASLAPARTFAMLSEAESMRQRGLFAHLKPADMLVIGPQGPIDNTLRFSDEPVRHKLLDLLGDLYLAGRPVQGKIIASRSGHALNQQLVRALLEQARRREPGRKPPAVNPDTPPAFDIKRILSLLPHRYPMVLVDRVIELEGDRRAVGLKNVTINEPFFQGHYPSEPIMPGVLIVEAMSQLAGLMLSQKLERTGKIAVLLSMDRVKLRRPVVPGDQLVMETEAVKATERFGDVQCVARVDGRLVAEARVKFMMVDAEPAR